ncbi:MAG: DUF4149 domain-containing protein [Gammaproteobacteria bacterium]|nr:MAG: DUF4149 domain-containing protein [Gammaproteobacteria bacterium]|tara:strand:- start:185 stop:571 length:387 start_codon:yes stop_codon:yes gene_type:complete
MNSILIFCSGLISGMIIFQSALLAPTVFKVIPEDQAGPFLRSIFPKLFFTIALIGAFSFLVALFSNDLLLTLIPLSTVIIMATCYCLIPMTNRARDKGDTLLFNRLHFISVALTVLVLLGNISLIIFI